MIDYLVKLRFEGQARLKRHSIEKSAKNNIDGGENDKNVVKFHVGNYVLLQYPNKLAGLHREPLITVAIERPDIIPRSRI